MLKKNELIFISFMLFSMFFGAGNLIFPAFLGSSAGEDVWLSLAGFITTAVGLPILGVLAVAKAGSFHTLANRVHPIFAFLFPLLIYVSIGPGLAIPRAGSIAYEMGMKPFLPETLMNQPVMLAMYTVTFFAVTLWLSLQPSKLVDRFGKLLTPILLIMISLIFVKSLITPMGEFTVATGAYQDNSFFQGFMDGYLTMDALAALVFGIVVANTIRSKGVQDTKLVSKYMGFAGLGAGILLASIYTILGFLGASSASLGEAENGAGVLTIVMNELFGGIGIILLGLLFTLACLCVCIGLIISCSQYFSTLFPKLSYKKWAVILAVLSLLVANLGLNQILSISVPILGAIYPIAVVLILLGLVGNRVSHSVYLVATIFTAVFSVIETINTTFLNGMLDDVLGVIPLYEQGVGWILPALVGVIVGFFMRKIYSQPDFEEVAA
ncbi:branched-chain amino acid transport system II carrier protein [Metabacillus halosaccharovorans]|uniref:branched-chain amino acid transport system II carrier protein n=1 Tax=Metabacillus halosaccharovorans TaxID=930124 RepID=UPI001C1F83DA|nr:branched-chain amino acid transport system II carrier protein [Metabacillus halosaccharovorans]MBU7594523.1 branched-chain amino acid transport system II carrier protein [Metabacillus halosaccharovorans]